MGMGTTSRDGGQDAKDATQGSYEVTIARPVGAHLRQGPKPTNQEKGTKPVKLRVRPGHSPETPTIISVKTSGKGDSLPHVKITG